MIGIDWNEKDFVNAMKSCFDNDLHWFIEQGHRNNLHDTMKFVINRIFIHNLKGPDIEILRQAQLCYYTYGFYPSQCYSDSITSGKYKEGEIVEADTFEFKVLNWNGEFYFVRFTHDNSTYNLSEDDIEQMFEDV